MAEIPLDAVKTSRGPSRLWRAAKWFVILVLLGFLLVVGLLIFAVYGLNTQSPSTTQSSMAVSLPGLAFLPLADASQKTVKTPKPDQQGSTGDKRGWLILYIIIIALCVVWMFSVGMMLFSTRPKAVKNAEDLVKVLTGTLVGVLSNLIRPT